MNKQAFTTYGRTVTTGYSGLDVVVDTLRALPTNEAVHKAPTDHPKCERRGLDSFELLSSAPSARTFRIDRVVGHCTNLEDKRFVKATPPPLTITHSVKTNLEKMAAYLDGDLLPGVQEALDSCTSAGLDPAVYAWAERTACLLPRARTDAERLFPPDISELLPPLEK